jgi:transcriptional regulator with XRE-family HTH domain
MASPKGKSEQERAVVLGTLVRQLRRERGETLAQLAGRVPMSPSNLSRLELGKQGPPSDEAIESLAKALGAEPQALLQAAGRVAGGQSFEKLVLDQLEELRQDVQEVKQAVADKRST